MSGPAIEFVDMEKYVCPFCGAELVYARQYDKHLERCAQRHGRALPRSTRA